MIAALTLSALAGTWMCATPDQPRARFVYVFARNGTGSLTGIYPNRPRETIERFTYRIVDGQNVFKREPRHFPVLDDISVHGHVLEDNGYVFYATVRGMRRRAKANTAVCSARGNNGPRSLQRATPPPSRTALW
jgi:hypothetical protein